MTVATKKKELLKWISSINNDDIIDQLLTYKKQKNIKFNEILKDSISAQQVKEDTTVYIKSLNWKK